MERDFMGLNFKDHLVKVKEEVDDCIQDSGFIAMPLPGGSSLVKNLHLAEDQSPSIPHKDKMHLDAMYNPSILKQHFRRQNPLIKADFSTQNSLIETHFSEQNFPSTMMTLPVHASIPATNSHVVHHSNASVCGMTEPRCTSDPAGAPAELTIFYAGKVKVYNDISPEKAQAIMFLAGNGCSTSSRPPPEVKAVAPAPNYLARDDAFVNTFSKTSLCSALSSPMSVSSHPIGQTIGGIVKTEEPRAYKTIGTSSSNFSKVPTSKLETSLGRSPSSILPSAVPQARKASLARFLEKRKERVMCSSPYLRGNRSKEGTAESSADFSATSDVVSCTLSMEKDNI